EGLDARLIQIIKTHLGAHHVPPLPFGSGWLMVEVGGDTPELARQHAEAVVAASNCVDSEILPAGREATRMWNIRADGAGLAGRTLANQQAWPGWEDSAVPPEHLGAYLRELLALLDRYGFDGVPYGHFGDGCIHMRVDFPLEHPGHASEKMENARPENGSFRAFMLDAGDLAVRFGGSMSGEHGDGRARSELLPKMYSPAAIELLAKFKGLFDPENNLNPGIIVDPVRMESNLRRPQPLPIPSRKPSRRDGRAHHVGRLHGIAAKAGYNGFAFSEDDHDLTKAVHRCMGVGKCRAGLGGATGSFMCPSYAATRDEKDVTRGRARVLQEAVNGSLIHGLTSPEVRESLDLCLSCKACSSDCPAVVDISRWKSEVLYRTYRGRLRPVDHYVLGWLPRWLRVLAKVRVFVPLINAVIGIPGVSSLVLRLGGMDPQRSLMKFSRTPFHVWWRRHGRNSLPASADGRLAGVGGASGVGGRIKVGRAHGKRGGAAGGLGRPVVLWTDSFSDGIATSVPKAAVKVLTAAGYQIIVPDEVACCGLTWISTGQLDGARKRLEKLMAVLGPYAVNGIPILGLEPSCTALLRSDLLDLFPDDPRAKAIAAATYTFAELVTDPDTAPLDWQIPDLSDLTAVVQPHCHHHSVMGFARDEELLKAAGAKIEVVAGCCGLAGNFGMQKGHYDISVKVAENSLLPALREAPANAEFVADGFSCRTQAAQLVGTEGKALVEVIAERL
ncbi:MAG: 4Fe-4S dicluster domain-containing protein, partial [Promicromonosporaceae bacterium]|nr:4Fe-4S dicluster domain-containing protein [Promicromonosporaceae bacterium]